MNLIEEAKKIWNGHACLEDIDLLVEVLGKFGESPTVVMLGAGEVMMLPVFGTKPKAVLYSIDVNPEPHNWELVALNNCEVKNANLVQIVGNSVEVAKSYKGPKIDLLIIDSDHSVESVWDDLNAWKKHLAVDYYIICHDYEAKDAPYFYPGVKKACDKYFDRKPDIKKGWSAVFSSIEPKKTAPKKKVAKKTPRKKVVK